MADESKSTATEQGQSRGRPCTCSQQGVYCRGAANLGAGWYCERIAPAAQQAPAVQAQISPGAIAIAEERARQMTKEGWTPEHDDEHIYGQLSAAAACYATAPIDPRHRDGRSMWPWDEPWDKRKKHDRRQRLVIAGALLAAEIDRLDRANGIAAPVEVLALFGEAPPEAAQQAPAPAAGCPICQSPTCRPQEGVCRDAGSACECPEIIAAAAPAPAPATPAAPVPDAVREAALRVIEHASHSDNCAYWRACYEYNKDRGPCPDEEDCDCGVYALRSALAAPVPPVAEQGGEAEDVAWVRLNRDGDRWRLDRDALGAVVAFRRPGAVRGFLATLALPVHERQRDVLRAEVDRLNEVCRRQGAGLRRELDGVLANCAALHSSLLEEEDKRRSAEARLAALEAQTAHDLRCMDKIAAGLLTDEERGAVRDEIRRAVLGMQAPWMASDIADAAMAIFDSRAARLSTAPRPVVQAGEPLSLDRYTRTACQITCGEIEADDCDAFKVAEDRAIERVQALLTPAGRRELARDILAPLGTLTECADTPAGRLQLAAEQLEPLGLVSISILPHDFDALAAGQCINEKIEGRDVVRSVLFYLGKVSLHLFQQRPASLDDARRLLEK